MKLISRARRDESGLSIVLVAIVMVALLTITALILDGGQAYSDRRQMQNAADAGAMAGARTLYNWRFNTGTTASQVESVALSTVQQNGGQASHFTCSVVDKTGAAIANCSDTAVWTTATTLGVLRAVGVKVKAGETRNTSFAQVIGVGTIDVNTTAAATIQPVKGANSPFLVCGNSFNRDGEEPPILIPNPALPAPLPNADPKTISWVFNTGQLAPATPTAVGARYPIHSGNPGILANCGSGSSFKGLNNCDPDAGGDCFTMPGWLEGGNGTRTGPSRIATSDACAAMDLDDLVGTCTLAVPICVDGTGTGNDIELYCVAIGAFVIDETNGNVKHYGTFRGAVQGTGGQTGTGDPTAGGINVVKLFE